MNVVIIGGSAAGAKTAARLRRLKPEARITLVEQGEYLSYGSCGFPMYVGRLVPDFDELCSTSYGVVRDANFFASYKGIEVLTKTQAVAVDRERKKVHVKRLDDGQVEELAYDYLVLCTGAKPVVPDWPGVGLQGVFTMHHPRDVIRLREYLIQNKITQVCIIGAGLIGLETADALSGGKRRIAVCESGETVLPKLLDPEMAKLVEHRMRRRGIELYLNAEVTALRGDENGRLATVVTTQGEIPAEMAVIAIGVKPNTELAQKAGLELGQNGALKVNAFLQTSDPAIYAAGDCVEHYYGLYGVPRYLPLASTANKQGRTVANNLAGMAEEFPPVYGTSVLQAFDLNIGRVGLGEAEAQRIGFDVISNLTTGLDAAHFYPMHSSITLKLIADRVTGRLLGAQVCGEGEGIKRLDVLATAIRFGATLSEIAGLDLGYAPPFATALDPAIHAANALENKRRGLVRSLKPGELLVKAQTEKICLVDVREQEEAEANPIAGFDVRHIPLGELRRRMDELPQEAVLVTICELGIRGYEAACYLKHSGFQEVYYLEGGLSTMIL